MLSKTEMEEFSAAGIDIFDYDSDLDDKYGINRVNFKKLSKLVRVVAIVNQRING